MLRIVSGKNTAITAIVRDERMRRRMKIDLAARQS
jgi:hypothetical protein